MSVREVDEFFEQYVNGFILADIEREIAFAKSGLQVEGNNRMYSGGGNYLCALGLLCYTEFMGAIYLGTFNKSPHQLFDAFFYLMGPSYKAFDEQLRKQPSISNSKKKLSVYEVFRCGMAHTYFIKKGGAIFMPSKKVNPVATLDSEEPSLKEVPSVLIGPIPCGIGRLNDGQYFFDVEQYYMDFANTCRRVHSEILGRRNPSIPS